jgi:hypothetical protein
MGAGFVAGLLFWYAFRAPYERLLAAAGEVSLRLTESPPVTRLEAGDGEFLVERSDFPPAAPRPGLPAADLDFNFALLTALFAMDPKPWRTGRVSRLLAACGLLFLTHVAALFFEVRALYATRLGEWSGVRYGAIARTLWAGGAHFYAIAGRFAAPFAIWWPFRGEAKPTGGSPRRRKRRR